MEKIKPEDAINDMTMMLMYLTRFTEESRFSAAEDFYAWKGYNFGVLNKLDDEDKIRQGNHPSRTKRVYLTQTGKEYAQSLLKKYGIEDWQQN